MGEILEKCYYCDTVKNLISLFGIYVCADCAIKIFEMTTGN